MGMDTDISPEVVERARELTSDSRRAAQLGQLAAHLEHERRHQELLHPEGPDRGLAVALTVLTLLQIVAFANVPWLAGFVSRTPPAPTGVWPYVVAAGCFLPLAWRNRRPGPAFVAASAFTILYMAMPWPPAIVLVGPWLALYTFGSRYGGKRTVPLAIVVVGVSLGISALSVSQSLSVLQGVGMFALLAVAGALGASVQTRRELFAQIQKARDETQRRRIDEERLRIAREVHDIMAHSLTLMTVQADAGAASFDGRPERAREALAIIGETGRSTLRDLRSMLDVLTDGEQDSPRTPVADLTRVAELVGSVSDAGLATSLDIDGDIEEVPTVVAVAAYRIIQESLTNAVRHSGATKVRVHLAVASDELNIEVADDGRGQQESGAEPGRGLRGMQERVTALGGTFGAGPGPRNGFRVHARIPYPRSA